MKKKIFSAYDIIFIISIIAVFIYAVFVSPVHSIADQGDFERVMRPCGLDFPSDYSFYDYAVRFFNMKFTSVDLLLLKPTYNTAIIRNGVNTAHCNFEPSNRQDETGFNRYGT